MASRKKSQPRVSPNLNQVLPPAGGSVVVPPVQQFAGINIAGKNFFRNPDEAYQVSPENSYRMWYDLDIAEPLQARILACAQLPWYIEPEEKKDKLQVERASEVQRIIEETPGFLKLKVALLHAIWFGKYAIQNEYEWAFRKGRKYLRVKRWSPVHGDSIYFKFDSQKVGVLCTLGGGIPGTVSLTTEPTDIGPAHVLSDHEREAFIIHTHLHLSNDWHKLLKAGQVKGIGLRDSVYWTWWNKNESMGLLQEYMERVGLGMTIYRYEASSPESLAAVQKLAENQTSNMQIFWPRTQDKSFGGADIERIEPSSVGMTNFMEVINEYRAELKRMIVGQDLTSESNATGLGSNLADVHQNTFMRLVSLDATNLEETFTTEFVNIIHKYSFPEDDFKLKFKIAVEKPDPKEYIEAAKSFIEMGGSIIEDEVRDVLGFTRPDTDDVVLSKAQMEGQGMPGEMPTDELPGELPEEMPEMSEEETAGEVGNLLSEIFGAMGVNDFTPNTDAILAKMRGQTDEPVDEEPVEDESEVVDTDDETEEGDEDSAEPTEEKPEEAGTTEDTGDDVQDLALNGAQISSLLLITDKLATGLYPVDACEALLRASFPALSDEQIRSILAPLSKAKKPQTETKKNQKKVYRLSAPPFEGAVFDETKHRWVTKEEAKSGNQGGKKAAPQALPDDKEAWDSVKKALTAEFPKEMASPENAAKAERISSTLKEKIYGFLYRANPLVIGAVEAVFDTPDDMRKIGYEPAMGTGHGTADPLKAATGLPTHMAISIASKVLAAGLVWAKHRKKKTSSMVGRKLVNELVRPSLAF